MQKNNIQKKAIIVGGTSGIGKSLAKILLKKKYKICVIGRRINLLDNLQSKYLKTLIVEKFDIRNTENTKSIFDKLEKKLGGLDLVIVSSAITATHKDKECSDKDVIDTNITGFTSVMDWSYNYFKRKKAGHIVAITSIAGLSLNTKKDIYRKTKKYQIKYIKNIREKMNTEKNNVLITDIRPGFVRTRLLDSTNKMLAISSKNAANKIYKDITKKKKVAYIPKIWALIGAPLELVNKVLRKI